MKKIKMGLYGEPGVGKSVFASKWPKPFFITTDGNYEWLEDFGAKPEDHIQVYSWSEAKKVFEQLKDDTKYETIVVDLTEDLFKWCEAEYCEKAKIDHVSDVGYGKGYDISRNQFFIEICKLFNIDKHILLLMHGITLEVKDRRGVAHTKYVPSNRIPDKVLDMIEGRTRYFLRCYVTNIENTDGTVSKQRMLSIVPKENEFGILRGIDENKIPQDIPLDFNAFAEVVGLYSPSIYKEEVKTDAVPKITKDVKREVKKEIEKKVNTDIVKDAEVKVKEEPKEKVEEIKEKVEEINSVDTTEENKEEIKEKVEVEAKPEVKEVKQEPVKNTSTDSNQSKIDAIKAKLAAIKAGKR